MKPSGSTRCSVVSVATQSRPIEPVFCGISGATSTTCTGSAERDAPAADRQHESAVTGDGVAEELVVRRTQESGLVTAALYATVEDVLGADPERRGIERLRRLVVEPHGEAARGIAVDLDDDPRRVLDHHGSAILAEL